MSQASVAGAGRAEGAAQLQKPWGAEERRVGCGWVGRVLVTTCIAHGCRGGLRNPELISQLAAARDFHATAWQARVRHLC